MKLISMFRSFYEIVDFYAIDLNSHGPFKEGEYADYNFKIVKDISGIQELKLHIDKRGKKYKQVITKRLESGNFYCFCFIEKASGNAAYARWLRRGSFYDNRLKKNITLADDEAFTMDSYTPIEFRGKGLHKEMNKRMLNSCKNELKISKVFMIIFRGKEYAYLHKIVFELGYRRIQSHFNFKTDLFKRIIWKIKKTNVQVN